jgi:hypothetical protein
MAGKEKDPAAKPMSGSPHHPAVHPKQRAGQDESLRARLKEDPTCQDAQLDVALDETMDASDPPSTTQPGHDQPVPSSGFKE